MGKESTKPAGSADQVVKGILIRNLTKDLLYLGIWICGLVVRTNQNSEQETNSLIVSVYAFKGGLDDKPNRPEVS